MQNYNQNQYGNQGYPQPQPQPQQQQQQQQQQQPQPQQQQQQQQQYNNNQYGNAYDNNQGNNWQQPPNQNQQYNNQYNNQAANNWQPPPSQNQYTNNQSSNNWQPPPNQNQQHNNQHNNNNQNIVNSQPPNPNPNQQYNNNQSWQNEPTTKVTQKGNMTITETTQSGGGKSSNRSDVEFNGPTHFGPGNIPTSGPHQPTNEQEKYDYFRLKLYESSCCCLCNSGNDHPCLNLWIWAIFWLIIFIFNGLINLIGSLARVSRSADSTGTYTMISIIIIIASLCVNFAAMYGLFKLKPVTFLVQIIFFIVFLLLVIIGLFVYELNIGFVVMNILFIICDIWALYSFWKVYQWGKHFKSGGKYEPDMNTPP